jgi:hypothetical protein
VLSLYVYQGSAANDPPSTLLVGPIDMSLPFTNVNQTVHFELPATVVGQDLWIGLGWSGPDGPFAGSNRGAPSVGTSQDVSWLSIPGQTPVSTTRGLVQRISSWRSRDHPDTDARRHLWRLKATYR